MTEPTDPYDNVVHLRFKKRSPEDLPTAPIKKSSDGKDRPFCSTHFFEYDMDERTVSCTRCGRSFDPLEALDHLSKVWQRYDWAHRNARQEIADLKDEHDHILKQVKNLKSQRRRLVPNVRQDVERVRNELGRHGWEKNPEIRDAIMRTIRGRIDKILSTLEAFGGEPSTPAPTMESKTGGTVDE